MSDTITIPKKRVPTAHAIAVRAEKKTEKAVWKLFLSCPHHMAKWGSGIHDAREFEFALEDQHNLKWFVHLFATFVEDHKVKHTKTLALRRAELVEFDKDPLYPNLQFNLAGFRIQCAKHEVALARLVPVATELVAALEQ